MLWQSPRYKEAAGMAEKLNELLMDLNAAVARRSHWLAWSLGGRQGVTDYFLN